MNKKILIIIGTIIVLAIIVILSLSSNNLNSNLNLDDLKRNIFKQYNEFNLRVLENEEIRNYFGIDLKDDIDSLFITDYFVEENPKPFSPNVLIVVVNSKDYHDYATLLKNYIDVEIMNSLDMERVNKYKEAIIEEKRNYYYLALGTDKNIVTIIEDFFNN